MHNAEDEIWRAKLQSKLQSFKVEPQASALESIQQKLKGGPSPAPKVTSAGQWIGGFIALLSIGILYWYLQKSINLAPVATSIENQKREIIIENKGELTQSAKATNPQMSVETTVKKKPSSDVNQETRPYPSEASNSLAPEPLPLSEEVPEAHKSHQPPVTIAHPSDSTNKKPAPLNFYERMKRDTAVNKKQQLFK